MGRYPQAAREAAVPCSVWDATVSGDYADAARVDGIGTSRDEGATAD